MKLIRKRQHDEEQNSDQNDVPKTKDFAGAEGDGCAMTSPSSSRTNDFGGAEGDGCATTSPCSSTRTASARAIGTALGGSWVASSSCPLQVANPATLKSYTALSEQIPTSKLKYKHPTRTHIQTESPLSSSVFSPSFAVGVLGVLLQLLVEVLGMGLMAWSRMEA